MAKIYTLDKKLLTGVPEIRIGDKVFPVDDRKTTVSKILEVAQDDSMTDEQKIDKVFELAFGKKYPEIKKLVEDISWAAYQELFSLVLAAVTGQEQDGTKSDGDSSGS